MSTLTGQQEPPPGHVLPAFPLTLLEAMRAHDRPAEVLEDEDVTISMPRRLGLTDVIGTQIRRYEAAQKQGKPVPYAEVVSLIQLVLRRPDGGAILWQTGQKMAERRVQRVPKPLLRLMRILPGAGNGSAARVSRRLLRRLSGGGDVQANGRPFEIRFVDSPLATLDQLGTGCSLYSGALEYTYRAYTGNDRRIEHVACRGRGDTVCEWREAEA